MIPADCVPAEGERVMEITSPRDSLGRCTYVLYWPDYVGPRQDEWGTRAQHFHGNPDRNIEAGARVVDRSAGAQP